MLSVAWAFQPPTASGEGSLAGKSVKVASPVGAPVLSLSGGWGREGNQATTPHPPKCRLGQSNTVGCRMLRGGGQGEPSHCGKSPPPDIWM